MKFTCDDCGAQYMIADDKIGPRGVKVRCKKCAHVIVLRPDGTPPSVPPPSLAPGAPAASLAPAPPPAPAPSFPPPASFEASPAKAEARPVTASMAPVAVNPPRPPLPSFEPPKPRKTAQPPPPPDQDEDEATVALNAARPAPSAPPSPFGDMLSSDFGLSEEFAAKGFDPPAFAPPAPLDKPRADTEVARRDTPAPEPAPPNDSPFSGPSMGGSLGALASEEFAPPPPAPAPSPLSALAGMSDRLNEAEQNTSVDYNPVVPSRPPEAPLASAIPPNGEFDEVDTRVARAQLDREALVAALANAEDFPGLDEALANGNGHAAKPSVPASVPAPAGRSGPRGGAVGPATVRINASEGLAGLALASTGENLEEEIGSAFEAVFGAGAGIDESAFGGLEAGDEVQQKPTRVFDTDAMKRVQIEQEMADHTEPAAASMPPEPAPAPEVVQEAKDWYVAVADEQVGPMTLSELKVRWDRREIDANSLSWKQGMGDWIAIRLVPDLESLTQSAAPTPSKVTKPDLSDEPPTRANVVAGVVRPAAAAATPVVAEKKEEPKPAALSLAKAAQPSEPPDSGWRPNAASALASLAEAESSSSSLKETSSISRPPRPSFEPGDRPSFAPLSGSMFGAGEQTSTRPKGLPKSPDLASSVSLRDPTTNRGPRGISMPMAIVAGCAILAITVIGAIFALRSDPPPPVAVAPVAPATAAPAPTAAARPVEPAPNPAAVAAATASAAAAAAAVVAAAPVAPAPAALSDLGGGKGDRREKGRRTKEGRESRESGREAREPKGKREKDPMEIVSAPVPASRSDRVEADDLLADGDRSAPKRAAPTASAESEDLPDQLDETDILRVLRKYKSEISACKDKQTKDDPSLEGVMTVNMVVLKSGRTSQPVIAPDKFRSSTVGKCVLNSVKGWKFPQFTGRPMPIDFPVPVRGRG